MQLHSGFNGYVFTLEELQAMVGPGWSGVIERLVQDLEALGWDGTVYQVKEKFGGLRFYIGGATDAIFKRISEAEEESYRVCENCGKPGEPTTSGWIQTLCEECRSK